MLQPKLATLISLPDKVFIARLLAMSSRRFHRGGGGGGGGNLHGSIIKSRMAQQNRQPQSRSRFAEAAEGQGAEGEEMQAHASMMGAKRPTAAAADQKPRPGPPPHLKGRDIGLWYAKQNAGKKKQQSKSEMFMTADNQSKMKIVLTPERQAKIRQLVGQLRALTPEVPGDDISSQSTRFQACYLKNVRENQQASSKEGDLVQEQEPKGLLFDPESVLELGENPRGGRGPIPIENFRNTRLDRTLWEELQSRENTSRDREMMEFRKRLPTHTARDEIMNLILENQVVVIEGETGSGKTTQIPQYILDQWISDLNGSVCNVVCTQPRRISAITVAERVAQERSEKVGGKQVGYSIRLENKMPIGRTGGTIVFCTTGILLQHLISDPHLSRVSHLVLDEVHERDVLNDFLLAMVKDLLIERPDMKVILMSATINAQQFAAYFNNCKVCHVPGFVHPVEEYYLEDVLENTKFQFERLNMKHALGMDKDQAQLKLNEFERFIVPFARKLESSRQYSRRTTEQLKFPESEILNIDLIFATIENICKTNSDKTERSILVFLPGWGDISKLHRIMTESGRFPESWYQIIPVHSMMPTVNQREVFSRPPKGVRKIVLATNIAETSVTIDDIYYVIDSGKIKMTNFDVDNNLGTLAPEWVSKANARQRKGRAGRTQPGVCYHLYTRAREERLEEFKKPEVLRKGLQEEILRIKILKLGDATQFFNRLMDPPRPESVQLALKRLRQLHALDEHENLTPLGFHLAQLPMDPQSGRMILMGAIFSCCDPILSVAASLSFRDPFYVPLGQEEIVDKIRKEFSGSQKSDHIALINAVQGYEEAAYSNAQRSYCNHNYLASGTLYQLGNMKRQFAEYLKDSGFLRTLNYKDSSVNVNSQSMPLLKGIICSGLYPNVAKIKVTRRGKNKQAAQVYTEDDGQVKIHPKSVNFEETAFGSPFLIYHMKMKSTAIYLHDTTMVGPFPLLFFGGELDFIEAHGYGSVGVDGTIRFLCDRPVYLIIDKLRRELDKLLEYKIQHPGPTQWNGDSREAILLQAINELITTEEELLEEDGGPLATGGGAGTSKSGRPPRASDWESDDEYTLPNPDL